MAAVLVSDATPSEPSGAGRLIAKPKDGDYIDFSAGKSSADVVVGFGALTGRLAFWIEAADSSELLLPVKCLSEVPKEAYLVPGVREGTWRLCAAGWEPPQAALAATPSTPADLASGSQSGFGVASRAEVCFTVRRFEDFAPSYEWKPLARWHRVPPGLEVDLDLGGEGAGNRARIPQPWQWDAQIAGEAAPRRLAVKADSTMAQLLEQLGFTSQTHEVVWRQPDGAHERVLDCQWTATQTDLFRYAKQIEIRRR